MKRALFAFVAVMLLNAEPLLADERGGVIVSYSEPLEFLSLKAEEGRTETTSSTDLVFDALGQRFELELEPNDRLLSKAFPEGLGEDIAVYRGHLAGKPDSWARITIADGVPTGLIWDGKEMLAIDASLAGANDQRVASIYRLADTYVEAGTMGCGVDGGAPNKTTLATAYAAVVGELETVNSQAAGAVEELKIGLVGDYEFTNFVGSNNVDAEILARMNNVDGIFSSQLGVQIKVAVIDTFTDPNDPFTTSVPNDLLNELAAYRLSTSSQTRQGLTFLFTGRNLDGTTVGIAYRDALCSSRFGAGLSEGVRNMTTDSLIAAHEIGHIFGADHDGEAGSVCASVTGDFLMSPRVNGSDQFSSCSIDTIRPNIEAASCINPLPATDVAVSFSGNLQSLLLGTRTTLVFEVANNGTQDAANVTATFDIPANLALDSIAATAGSCTSGAGQATCAIGTVAGGSSVDVALSVMASSVGTSALDATVTADGDANLGDNAQSVTVVVNPATDLRVANVTTSSVTLNGTATINPRIDNLSSLAATDIALTISLPGGLQADSASWPGGTCTASANSVSCQRSSLAAGADVTLDIQLTAVSAGAQTYTANVSALEADLNEANNSATGTVNVTSASGGGSGGSGSSDGGGGAFDFLWMFLSGLAVFGIRSRRT